MSRQLTADNSTRNYFPAKVLSYLFHPLLLPTYAVLLLFLLPTYLSNYQYEYKKYILLVVSILTFILPLLVLMIMLNLRAIHSLTLNDRKERMYPYALASIIYISAYYILANFSFQIPSQISNFVLTSALIVFVSMLINFKIKVSAHMAGLGGFISFFWVFLLKENLSDYLLPFGSVNFSALLFLSALFLLAGLTASSRLCLGAHKGSQALLGFGTGMLIGLVNLFF